MPGESTVPLNDKLSLLNRAVHTGVDKTKPCTNTRAPARTAPAPQARERESGMPGFQGTQRTASAPGGKEAASMPVRASSTQLKSVMEGKSSLTKRPSVQQQATAQADPQPAPPSTLSRSPRLGSVSSMLSRTPGVEKDKDARRPSLASKLFSSPMSSRSSTQSSVKTPSRTSSTGDAASPSASDSASSLRARASRLFMARGSRISSQSSLDSTASDDTLAPSVAPSRTSSISGDAAPLTASPQLSPTPTMVDLGVLEEDGKAALAEPPADTPAAHCRASRIFSGLTRKKTPTDAADAPAKPASEVTTEPEAAHEPNLADMALSGAVTTTTYVAPLLYRGARRAFERNMAPYAPELAAMRDEVAKAGGILPVIGAIGQGLGEQLAPMVAPLAPLGHAIDNFLSPEGDPVQPEGPIPLAPDMPEMPMPGSFPMGVAADPPDVWHDALEERAPEPAPEQPPSPVSEPPAGFAGARARLMGQVKKIADAPKKAVDSVGKFASEVTQSTKEGAKDMAADFLFDQTCEAMSNFIGDMQHLGGTLPGQLYTQWKTAQVDGAITMLENSLKPGFEKDLKALRKALEGRLDGSTFPGSDKDVKARLAALEKHMTPEASPTMAFLRSALKSPVEGMLAGLEERLEPGAEKEFAGLRKALEGRLANGVYPGDDKDVKARLDAIEKRLAPGSGAQMEALRLVLQSPVERGLAGIEGRLKPGAGKEMKALRKALEGRTKSGGFSTEDSEIKARLAAVEARLEPGSGAQIKAMRKAVRDPSILAYEDRVESSLEEVETLVASEGARLAQIMSDSSAGRSPPGAPRRTNADFEAQLGVPQFLKQVRQLREALDGRLVPGTSPGTDADIKAMLDGVESQFRAHARAWGPALAGRKPPTDKISDKELFAQLSPQGKEAFTRTDGAIQALRTALEGDLMPGTFPGTEDDIRALIKKTPEDLKQDRRDAREAEKKKAYFAARAEHHANLNVAEKAIRDTGVYLATGGASLVAKGAFQAVQRNAAPLGKQAGELAGELAEATTFVAASVLGDALEGAVNHAVPAAKAGIELAQIGGSVAAEIYASQGGAAGMARGARKAAEHTVVPAAKFTGRVAAGAAQLAGGLALDAVEGAVRNVNPTAEGALKAAAIGVEIAQETGKAAAKSYADHGGARGIAQGARNAAERTVVPAAKFTGRVAGGAAQVAAGLALDATEAAVRNVNPAAESVLGAAVVGVEVGAAAAGLAGQAAAQVVQKAVVPAAKFTGGVAAGLALDAAEGAINNVNPAAEATLNLAVSGVEATQATAQAAARIYPDNGGAAGIAQGARNVADRAVVPAAKFAGRAVGNAAQSAAGVAGGALKKAVASTTTAAGNMARTVAQAAVDSAPPVRSKSSLHVPGAFPEDDDDDSPEAPTQP